MSQEVVDLRADFTKLGTAHQGVCKQYNELSAKYTDLEGEYKETKSERAKFDEQHNGLKLEYAKLLQKCSDNVDHPEVEKIHKEKDPERANFERQFNELTFEHKKLETKWQKLSADSRTFQEEAERYKEEADTHWEHSRQNYEQAQDAIELQEELNAHVDRLTRQAVQTDQIIELLEEEHDAASRVVDELRDEVKKLTEEKTRLETNESTTQAKLKDATKESKKHFGNVVALKKELKVVRENLRRCCDERGTLTTKLERCQVRGRSLREEIGDLQDQLRRELSGSADIGFSSVARSAPEGSQRVEGVGNPDTQSSSMDSRVATISRAPGGSYTTPPVQMMPGESSPRNTRASLSHLEPIESTSPLNYTGPQPVEESLIFSIIRCEAALGQMRDERAQHGFRDGDCRQTLTIAREIWAASNLLPEDGSGTRAYFRAKGAYLQGISLYYADLAARAAPWFRDAGVLDQEAYPARNITAWMQRIEEGGPVREAAYYTDPKHPGNGKASPEQHPPENSDDDDDGENDGHDDDDESDDNDGHTRIGGALSGHAG